LCQLGRAAAAVGGDAGRVLNLLAINLAIGASQSAPS
jgi:hypothetical protein